MTLSPDKDLALHTIVVSGFPATDRDHGNYQPKVANISALNM